MKSGRKWRGRPSEKVIMADEISAGDRKAAALGRCLHNTRGATCMRPLRKKKKTVRDGQGEQVTTTVMECRKHGTMIFTPRSDGK